MSIVSASLSSPDNRLLSKLPQRELERLLPRLEHIRLPRGKILFEARDTIRYAYFPLSGLVSLLAGTSAGDTIEIGMVGNEGMIGVPLVLRTDLIPYQVMVQIAGEGLRLDAESFKKQLIPGEAFEYRLLRYANALLDQGAQLAVCNHFHTVEARVCYKLLTSRDRVNSDTLDLTQEIISHLLGAPRTGVSRVANDLRDAGLIRYRRGKITILNRQGLERFACECYELAKDNLNHV
jgi:CRP-like cAMP-binding protein